MSIKATGQITLVDLTDGQLIVYLSSNLPKTQVYNKKGNSFSPDWRETNLQIVPNISLNQNNIDLSKATIKYKKLISQKEIELDSSKELVSNGILTVNSNVLNESANKTVTYIAYINYQNFSTKADLTFTLLNEGVDGEDGTSGDNGYTFILTNESYLFKGSSTSALNDTVATNLKVYQGTVEQKIKITSVNGKTASTNSTNTGITGLNFKVSTTSETTSPTITFISTNKLTQKNGSLPITFQMNGQTWTKFFSYGIALQGNDGVNYWMVTNTGAIKKDNNNEYTPSQIILESKNNTGVDGISDYYGRFLIEGTTDNNIWTTLYTSNTNESNKTYNITNINIIAYRCSLFLSEGTEVLLDRQIIPVVMDGEKGIDGIDGTSTYFYVKYSKNSNGNPMTDIPNNDTKYLGVCSTTAVTAPTTYTSYTWSEIRGKDGVNGSPGAAGKDGKTSYLHIKYSNDGTSFTENEGETLGNYIGTLVDFVEKDSNIFSDYTWKRFVGSDSYSLDLYSSDYAVAFDKNNNPKNNEDIILTAIQQNYNQNIVWSTNPSGITLGSSGATRTLAINNFKNHNQISVTITSGNLSDTVTIVKVQDGQQGEKGEDGLDGTDGTSPFSAILTNEAQTIAAENSGKVSENEILKLRSSIKVFHGTVECEAASSGNIENTYVLSIKSQNPNIGATINSTKDGFIATSVPQDSDSGNVILSVTMFDGTTIDKEFNWTKSKKGDTGESGADGLTVVLTNENHSFPATTNAATASSTSTKILAFKGSTETPIKIKTVNGKTVSTTSIATGITGLNFKVSSIGSVVEPTITFTASASLTTTNGSLPIVMEIDGQTVTKNFSFSLALKGASGANGTSITINSTSITYQVSTSGTVKPTGIWNPTIPSVPNGQYLWTKTTVKYSDGTTTDSYSVAYKGTNGIDGTDGKNGISTYTYIKYASNSNGSDMSDNPTNKTYIGVYTGTSATAPTSATSYTWSKFKGETGATGAAGADGKDGNGIKTISYYYKVTTTQTPPEASTITSTTIPSLSPTNKYLWQKEIIDFSDSAIADKTTVSLLAVYGNTGATGANGQNGEDAYLVDINPSSQIFKSTDGGSTFSPNTITLTPRFQNVSFGSWQYSINGGTTWTTITNTTSSTTNCYYSASTKVLTIPKNFSAYTETVTSIVFKCIGSISTVYDTVTVAKLYDVTDLEVGGKNLLKYTSYKNLKGVSVRGNYGTISIDTTNQYNNNNSLKIVTTAPATSGSKDIWQKCWNNNIIGLPIRLSLYIKGSVNANAFFRLAGATASNGNSASFKHSVTTSWTKISIDLGKITASGTKGATEIIYGFDRAGTFYINSMMLEYSTVYSDWSPAPEDTQAELDEKVERTSIKAAINASDETVKIEATNIDLEGYATFTSLAGNSTSVINGSNITTGTIKSKNYAQNNITSSRIVALNDDLSGATLNMSFSPESGSFFLDKEVALGESVLLIKTSNYYINYSKFLKGSAGYNCDEVDLYKNDGTLVEQLYFFDGQYGEITNLKTFTLPDDADRVLYSKTASRVFQMIKAKMTKRVAVSGMKISLEDGVIDSKNFSVSADGDIYISGKVKSKQDNILLNTDVFDILNDYGDLLMELNSYGMDFYDGSSARRYTGFIGHGIQDMTIYIGDGVTTETKLEQCDGLLIAAYPQESTTNVKNYFVGLGLANSDREVVPLIQAYGYPNSDASTEFHYTIDIGKTTFHETSSHCDGLRIKSGEVCSYYLNGGDLSLEEDADLTRWTLTLKSKSLKMGTSSSNIGTYPTILYDNSSGTNGTVNLKETTALFDYIDIIYKTNDNLYGTIRVYNPNGKTVDIFSENTDNNNKWIKSSIKQISGTQIITSRFMENTLTNGSLSLTLSNLIYITKVIGYK